MLVARINWESENRRTRLSKWIAQNDLSPKWWEADLVQQANLEAWAKRQSAVIVKRISKNSFETDLESILFKLNEAVQENNSNSMRFYAEKTMNEFSIRRGITSEELANLTLLVQMVICISEN